MTQLSKSTDNTINTWYLCSSVTADPRPPSTPAPSQVPPASSTAGQSRHLLSRLATCSPSAASGYCPLTLMGRNHGKGNPTLLSESAGLGRLLWCPHSPLLSTFYLLAHLWSQFTAQIPASCFCRRCAAIPPCIPRHGLMVQPSTFSCLQPLVLQFLSLNHTMENRMCMSLLPLMVLGEYRARTQVGGLLVHGGCWKKWILRNVTSIQVIAPSTSPIPVHTQAVHSEILHTHTHRCLLADTTLCSLHPLFDTHTLRSFPSCRCALTLGLRRLHLH